MSDHVLDYLADYLEGRLEAERVREIDAHLAGCPECAGDFNWAREFRSSAIASGLRHLPPHRVVELADGRGEPISDVERRHVDGCGACAMEISWARALPRPEEAAGALGAPAARRSPGVEPSSFLRRLLGQRWAVGALAAAAAAILLFVVIPRHPEVDLAALARVEPLPVRITRGPAEPGSFEESRVRGLEFYANRDYTGARESLQAAADLRPDDAEVALYLGSVDFLLGNKERALELLNRAAESAGESAAVREEALWQHANAALAAGRGDEARRSLEQVISMGRRHKAEAETLLGKIGATRRD